MTVLVISVTIRRILVCKESALIIRQLGVKERHFQFFKWRLSNIWERVKHPAGLNSERFTSVYDSDHVSYIIGGASICVFGKFGWNVALTVILVTKLYLDPISSLGTSLYCYQSFVCPQLPKELFVVTNDMLHFKVICIILPLPPFGFTNCPWMM